MQTEQHPRYIPNPKSILLVASERSFTFKSMLPMNSLKTPIQHSFILPL